jgi:hypothetical protein
LAGAIQLTEVDFDQIKSNLINYLKSTKQFTDYDFSGSNLQVILNLIAYQAQLNAYSTNMIANESFLSSATIRDNVVANARAVGYVPTSTKSSQSNITFNFQFTSDEFPSGYPSFIELQPGMVFVTGDGNSNYIFNAIEPQTAPVGTAGLCVFPNITVYEGTYLTARFDVNKSNFNQKFILENKNIDTSTIRVEVQPNPNEEYNVFYEQANSLVTVGENSNVYWVEETSEEYYELTFGDGYFGNELNDGSTIYVTYLTTRGPSANGIIASNNFQYTGRIITSDGQAINKSATVSSASVTFGGASLESVESVKFRAPRSYGAQNRAVIASDYETLIRQIYPATDDIYVYGGEELPIPEYGRVFVVIKPSTGAALSNTTKNFIIESLNEYRVASLQVVIQDPEILYLEIITAVYYNDKNTIKDASGIVSEVKKTLSSYFVEGAIDKFGGSARYSRIVGAIDDSDPSITRNITTLRMRKDFAIVPSTASSYEICFEQALEVNTGNSVVYSTGFQIEQDGSNDGKTYYFEDDTKGNIYLFYFDTNGTKTIQNTTFGTVDYVNGEVLLGYINPVTFINTVELNDLIKIRGMPFSQDVVAKKTVYLDLDIESSRIDAIIDTNIVIS